jgi:hypothetical protein
MRMRRRKEAALPLDTWQVIVSEVLTNVHCGQFHEDEEEEGGGGEGGVTN